MTDDRLRAVEVTGKGVATVDVVSHLGSEEGHSVGGALIDQRRLQKALRGGQVRAGLHTPKATLPDRHRRLKEPARLGSADVRRSTEPSPGSVDQVTDPRSGHGGTGRSP
jgi:hypothetical protein